MNEIMIVCPNCGHDTFNRAIKMENVKLMYYPDSESDEIGCIQHETVVDAIQCSSCGHTYGVQTEDEIRQLVMASTKCSKCGNTCLPDELDDEGVCEVCRAREQSTDFDELLKNGDREALIKALAKAQLQTSQQESTVETEKTSQVKKRRGRPPKKEVNLEEFTVVDLDAEEEPSDVEITENPFSDAMNPPEEESDE